MATRVLAARVQDLYAKLPAGLATVVVNSTVVALVLRGRVKGELLWAWLAAHWILSALRLGTIWLHRRGPGSWTEPRRGARIFTLGNGLSGIAWGASAILFFGQLGVPERFFVAIVLTGMTAGAASSSSSFPPAFLAFAIPALAPLGARFLLTGSAMEVAVGAMAIVFGAAMAAIARSGARTLREALRLRFRNESLVESLTAARGRLAAVNAGLEEQVRERSAQLVQMERRLAQSALLASVGSLAASVAHDINSPLSSVISNLGYLEREWAASGGHPDASHQEALAEARASAARVRDIVRDMGRLASLDEADAQPLDVREILDSCLLVAGSEIRNRARVVRDYADVPRVKGARASLAQVFLSLVVNAARAVPPDHPDEHQIRLHTRAGSDEQVVVEVTDTGAEIAEAERDRLFDLPSTEELQGGGARLGLSLCRGIVAGLGGSISVRRSDDRGNVFVVTLPAAVDPPRPRTP